MHARPPAPTTFRDTPRIHARAMTSRRMRECVRPAAAIPTPGTPTLRRSDWPGRAPLA